MKHQNTNHVDIGFYDQYFIFCCVTVHKVAVMSWRTAFAIEDGTPQLMMVFIRLHVFILKWELSFSQPACPKRMSGTFFHVFLNLQFKSWRKKLDDHCFKAVSRGPMNFIIKRLWYNFIPKTTDPKAHNPTKCSLYLNMEYNYTSIIHCFQMPEPWRRVHGRQPLSQ